MNRRLTAPLAAEALGTFLFVVVGAGSIVVGTFAPDAAPGLVGVALAHGLALAVLVSALGAVSGAHFNPAVTFGLWLGGRIDGWTGAAYVAAQLVSAVTAGLVLRAVFPESAWQPSHIGTPGLAAGISPAVGIAVEAILTVLLVLAVFGTAIDPRGPRVGGFAIGMAVAADILVAGPLTGAAMNPARWFGPALASGFLDNALVWIAGPLLGAAVAAAAYRTLFSAPTST
jgi:MIP family channel proteins